MKLYWCMNIGEMLGLVQVGQVMAAEKAQRGCFALTQGPHAGTLLACECLGKMDRPRDCLAEKGMPEPEGKKVWQGRGNMRVCMKRAMS